MSELDKLARLIRRLITAAVLFWVLVVALAVIGSSQSQYAQEAGHHVQRTR